MPFAGRAPLLRGAYVGPTLAVVAVIKRKAGGGGSHVRVRVGGVRIDVKTVPDILLNSPAADVPDNPTLLGPRTAARIRALHVVLEDALSGMRDAVGRHLALRGLSRLEAQRSDAALPSLQLDRRRGPLALHAVRRRARDGVDGGAHRGAVLIHTPLSTTSVLDEAAEVVSLTATPWAGVLIATALPYRFLQALFLDQLLEVGSGASHYGDLLGLTANITVATILIALWGRAVYARACRLALARDIAPGREAWRVPPASLASYVLTASTAMLLGYLSFFTVVGFPILVIFSGLAIGTIELNDRVSVSAPFAHIFRTMRRLGIPVALLLVFVCALFVALVNLAAAFELGKWLLGSLGGFDAPHWPVLFSAGNRRFLLILFAGAIVIVEPFWIAAHVIFVRKLGAVESGDDLRAWFDELRRIA
jgi:hypothetical protein